MELEVTAVRQLRFDDGTPVRAASGVAPYGDGRLVVQDDAVHAAWVRDDGVTRVQVFPAVEGHERFAPEDGTKHLKPDVEAATPLTDGRVLLLGSGSSPRRTRAAVVGPDGVVTADLAPLYDAVRDLLAVPAGALNLEGACVLGDRLRWFQRGAAHLPSSSVDVDLAALLAVLLEGADPREVPLGDPRSYDLGTADGVALAVTDAVALDGGRVLVSVAAEDTPDPVEDGPVVGAGVAVLDGERVVGSTGLPEQDGRVHKVEGLALLDSADDRLELVAVVDDDDAAAASHELRLRLLL